MSRARATMARTPLMTINETPALGFGADWRAASYRPGDVHHRGQPPDGGTSGPWSTSIPGGVSAFVLSVLSASRGGALGAGVPAPEPAASLSRAKVGAGP